MACSPYTMPIDNGLLTHVEFWPHWPADNTDNDNYVEPDVILHCAYRNIIIEAKYSDFKGQYREQWKKEIIAYRNLGDKKQICFIALGGNENYDEENIEGVIIFKCSWTSLLMAALSVKKQYEKISVQDEHISQSLRILKYIEQSFEAHGIYSLSVLDSQSLTKYPSYNGDNILEFNIINKFV